MVFESFQNHARRSRSSIGLFDTPMLYPVKFVNSFPEIIYKSSKLKYLSNQSIKKLNKLIHRSTIMTWYSLLYSFKCKVKWKTEWTEWESLSRQVWSVWMTASMTCPSLVVLELDSRQDWNHFECISLEFSEYSVKVSNFGEKRVKRVNLLTRTHLKRHSSPLIL